MWGKYAAYSPPTEMVAEVKVQTSTYDATVPRAPGGTVNMVLRSGTNQLHGLYQMFHTDQHLWGTLFILTPVSLRPIDRAHQR